MLPLAVTRVGPRPRRLIGSETVAQLLKTDGLSTLQKKSATNLGESTAFINDCQKMVARQLTDAAGEARTAVRHQKFCLAEPRWVPENLPWGWVARGVLVADTEIVVGEWYPSSLAAPARLDQLPLKGKPLLKRGSCLRCAFGFKYRGERHRTNSYGQHGHGTSLCIVVRGPTDNRIAVAHADRIDYAASAAALTQVAERRSKIV